MSIESARGNGRSPMRRAIGAIGAIGAVGALAATGFGAAAGATAVTPPNAASVAALYARAFADARAKGSAHETATIVAKDFRSTQSEDASTRGGNLSQTIIASGLRLSYISRLIGTKLWLKGDQLSLENSLGDAVQTAGLDAGYWIRVQTTSKYYESLSFGLNFPTSLAGIALDPPFTLSARTRLDGRPVYVISSTRAAHLSSTNGPQNGKFVLDVTAAAKPLPIAEVADFSVNGAPEQVEVAFSHWGEKVALATPKGPRPV